MVLSIEIRIDKKSTRTHVTRTGVKYSQRYRSVEEKTQQPRGTEVNNAGFLSFYLLLHSLYEKIYVLWNEVSRGNREEPFQDIL